MRLCLGLKVYEKPPVDKRHLRRDHGPRRAQCCYYSKNAGILVFFETE